MKKSFWEQYKMPILLLGGIAYTIGAVLYGIGSKKKWMHSVFHIFVDIGSLLHFLCVFAIPGISTYQSTYFNITAIYRLQHISP